MIVVEQVDSSGPGGDVPVEVAQAVEPTAKSHAPVEVHDESLVPKRQRGRLATHCWPSLGSPEHTVGLSRLRRTQLQTFADVSTETS